MKKLLLFMAGLFIFCAQTVWAQNYPVRGTITDSSKEPIVGANIKVKGTTVGTISNADGKFSLNVPKSAKEIEVSYIGFIS